MGKNKLYRLLAAMLVCAMLVSSLGLIFAGAEEANPEAVPAEVLDAAEVLDLIEETTEEGTEEAGEPVEVIPEETEEAGEPVEVIPEATEGETEEAGEPVEVIPEATEGETEETGEPVEVVPEATEGETEEAGEPYTSLLFLFLNELLLIFILELSFPEPFIIV